MKTKQFFGQPILPRLILVLALIAGPLLPQEGYSQMWPVNLDGAPTLKSGQIETALLFSQSFTTYDGETYLKGILPGIRVGFGIARNFDLKLSYSRGLYKFYFGEWSDSWEDTKVNNITLCPKVGFLNGIIAIKLPFTAMLYNMEKYEKGETSKELKSNYLLGPKILISFHYKKYVEGTVSPFCEILMYEGGSPEYFVGGSLGFAFSSNLERWSIRPEGFVSYNLPQGEQTKGMLTYGYAIAATVSFDVFKSGKGSGGN
jgi:hypothetical protein